MTKRVRLLKVIVQPVFVVDDDEDDELTEVAAEPVIVTPRNWPTYATTTFQESMSALQEQLGAESDTGD